MGGLQELFDPAPELVIKNQRLLRLLTSGPNIFPRLLKLFHPQVFAHTWLACFPPPQTNLPPIP